MNKYKIEYTTKFKKSYKKMIKQGYKPEDFEKVLEMLAKDEILPERYRIIYLILSRRLPLVGR